MKLRLLSLLAAACLFALAGEARASDIYWTGGALETAPSSSCSRTSNVGSTTDYTSMDCGSAGSPVFTALSEVPPDAGLTFKVYIHWYTTSGSLNNVCWKIANDVCTTNAFGCTYPSMTPGNEVSTTAIANNSQNTLMESVLSANETFYSDLTTSNCVGTGCNGKPLMLRITRDNSCASNLAATVKVVGVRLVTQ